MGAIAAQTRVAEIDQMLATMARGPQALTAAGGVQAPDAAASPTSFASTLQAASAPSTTPGSTGGDTQYDALIQQAATKHGVDPSLLKALVKQESGFNPNAQSSAGAQGLTQLMPGTAAGLGVTNPLDPAQALDGGAKYLKQQLDRFGGDERKALAAYNAGPGAVQRFGGVPPFAETQTYVTKVLGYAQELRAAAATAVATPATTQALPASALSALGATTATTPTQPLAGGALPYSTT
ncbi:lytic transglycosylase domain-containing protein [Conexibacter sp. SYSU D00693]|uniref:lytic transglycosylase domain-containing protein n=1 Tax=Conexibacter sp. SYSU D00693 TaxID=2812560 RepID=UPI0027388D70|nr:lytic transglycosylase domain-containing protein [Conexibacter sp. SYSU D00693]